MALQLQAHIGQQNHVRKSRELQRLQLQDLEQTLVCLNKIIFNFIMQYERNMK